MVLALFFYLFFRVQYNLSMDSLLSGETGDRIERLSRAVVSQLGGAPEGRERDILRQFDEKYGDRFFIFEADGTERLGDPLALPAEVQEKLGKFQLFAHPAGRPEGEDPGPGLEPFAPPGRPEVTVLGPGANVPRPKFLIRTDHPAAYWVGLPLPPLRLRLPGHPPYVLLIQSDSLTGHGLFLDLTPWFLVGAGTFLVTLLFWFPFVRSMTRTISQMTAAAQEMAHGKFEARVDAARSDELGRLGETINQMNERISGFVTGQKRFLGDVAHELCAPLARLQLILGILEQKPDKKQTAVYRDLREEVDHISELVNELLSFSKAGLSGKEARLIPVSLSDLAQRVIHREAGTGSIVEARIPESLKVMADPDLLARALSNLLRNALRYAGTEEPIVLSAVLSGGGEVEITLADSGPGVPEENLEKIFDPFFRLENSRSRETGGVGLGLSIVRTCVTACQGTVRAQNRKPRGLEMAIRLRQA